MTTFEYDRAGRVVRAVTVREAEYSPDDVAALIASRRAANVRRGPHGYTMTEATDPANQFAFEVKPPKKDWAAKALHDAQETFFKRHPDAKGDPSFVWTVALRDS